MVTGEITFTKGNDKLKKAKAKRRANARRWGTPVFNWNLRAIETCPGRTSLCEALCYADRGRYTAQIAKYRANKAIAENFLAIVERVENLPKGSWLRIHASGDFYSADYIAKWTLALAIRPDVKAWAYTRSWSVPELLPALEQLRALPNVQLFASVDASTIGAPPSDWRIATLWQYKQEDKPDNHLVCPEQTGAMSDCADCGFCVIGKAGNVAFKQH